MAVASVEKRPALEPHAEYPGLHPGMMGMYIFLCSEVMFFGGMFATYFYLLGSHGEWPPHGTIPVQYWPLPAINSIVLLSSGVTCHFGLEALRHGGRQGAGGIVGAVLLAIGCVAALVMGVAVLAADGFTFDAGLAFFGAVLTLAAIPAMLGLGAFARGRGAFFFLWAATIVLGIGFEAGQAYEFITARISFSSNNEFANMFFTMTGFHGVHVAGGIVLLLLVFGRSLRGQFNARHNVAPSAITLYWHFVDVVWIFLFGILYFAVTYSTVAAGGGG